MVSRGFLRIREGKNDGLPPLNGSKFIQEKISMVLLELKNISKSYHQGGALRPKQRHCVLKNINLNIDAGTCLGLLGRNGSGKSTLGRILLGLESPDSGMVCYKGKDIAALSKADYRRFRRNVQVVFQNSIGAVNHRFRAVDIVAEPIRNFESLAPRDVRSKVARLLRQVGLDPSDMNKYPHQFSGGELQRLCIARSIALTPELIVLDEAVSSLDMLIQAKIIDLLQELRIRLKIALLFISHDIRAVLRLADRLAVMQDGKIVDRVDDTAINTADRDSFPALSGLIKAILPPAPS